MFTLKFKIFILFRNYHLVNYLELYYTNRVAACHTVKFLVWVLPNGNIARVSTVYPGSTSDKELFSATGWVELLNPGDRILADKGFLLADLLPDG